MSEVDRSYLLKARGISAVGGIAVLLFDLVLINLMPDEPAYSGPRYFCAAFSFAFLGLSFVSEHIRRNASSYMMVSVSVYSLVWSYNLFLSQFSPAIALTFFVMLVGTSATLLRRVEVATYLILCSLFYCVALVFAALPLADTAVFFLALVTLAVLCYVNLTTMIERQEEILRSRTLLKQVVEEIPDALWLGRDDDTEPEIANQPGRAVATELAKRVQQYKTYMGASDRSAWSFENEVCREDGSRYWGDVWIRPVGTGEQRLFLGRIGDITERREAQAALMQAKRIAEDALETRSRFLANMSHEIRTPMNGVVAMTGLLLESELDADQLECAETIRTSSEALISIINDILDFSKIDAGELELELQHFSIEQCVAEAAELMAGLAHEKELELTYVIEDNVPANCVGDMSRLRQVLLNLMSNAIKFTKQGEVVIKVWVESGVNTDGQQQVHFSVEDTGIGIPQDRQSGMFDPFTQADSSTTRVYGGTGLGLTICRQLTELMGGRISVSSHEGEGSRFHFYVTISQPEGGHNSLPELNGLRVLVVDDNHTNLRILRKILEKDGVELVEYSNPIEALEEIKAEPNKKFDAGIIDFHMPGMDGISLGRELQKLCPMPLMLLSSNALATGDDSFDIRINKPVRPSGLRQNLQALIGQDDASLAAKANRKLLRPDGQACFDELRVLVAEDNPVNQLVIKKVLNKLAINPDVVANGQEAVEHCQANDYDLVLMDVQMPIMDGMDATRAIRASASGKPHIIALTANAMDGDRELCLHAGMNDYLSKPVNLDALRSRLMDLVAE